MKRLLLIVALGTLVLGFAGTSRADQRYQGRGGWPFPCAP